MKKNLAVLWTNADKQTSMHMVLMYVKNSMLRGWWEEIELILWGATASLVVNDLDIQRETLECVKAGVKVGVCIACARNLGVYEDVVALGFDVKSYGPILTEYLQNPDKKLLTI